VGFYTEVVEPLISADRIAKRIKVIGGELSTRLEGRDVVLVGVLKGAFPFFADLTRAVDLPVRCDFVSVASYEGTESSGTLRYRADLTSDVKGATVVLVEDIVDTGLTMSRLVADMRLRGAAEVLVVSLLDKPSRRKVPVQIDYVGFEIPDAFVIGYGLDLDELYRNLPYVGVYRGSVPHD
jgi:hypoxanthine phosphoribosyltransferase